MSSSLPVVPPRPSRASATSPPDNTGAAPPVVPARPIRNRSKSPLPESNISDSAAAAADSSQDVSSERPSSPETKRKIDPDLDLHQPMAVRPAAEIPKAPQHDDIPEIGQRVPMLDFAGDVQAPSPAVDSRSASRAKRRSQHTPNLPPEDGPMVVGDFGAYPAGKVYRQNGSYSLSHDDLTKSVMTASGAGVATTPGLEGVPDEEIGYIVSDEIASRDATPQGTPGGVITAGHKLPTKSPLSTAISALEGENDTTHQLPNLDEAGNDSHGIYGKGGPTNASSTSLGVPTSGRHTPWEEFQDERAEGTPILASDEAGKYPVWNPPVISPRLSAQEVRRPPSSNRSRNSPSSVPVEDLDEPPSPIKEHVPLFPEGAAPPRAPSRPKIDKQASSQGFPSKDVWEDAPESSHATYEVEEEEQKPDPDYYDPAKNKITEKTVEGETAKETSSGLPAVPTRPTKRVPTDEASPDGSKVVPVVPERPKVPPRPLKKTSDPTSATESPTSPDDSRAPPPPKPKPVIPGRVGGGGIAALRANFMSDLNSRLSKGPVAPKKEEPAPEPEPKEREPLEDVRKTRARGPAKRKPSAAAGAASAADTAAPATTHVPKLTFSSIITVYSIGDDYEVSFDETKFDDEPSKIARPIDNKVLEAVKSEEAEEKKEESPVEAPVETEEKESSGPVEAVKEVAQKVVEAVVPSSATSTETEESKPESSTTTEEKTVVA